MDTIKVINQHTRQSYNLIADKYFELFKDELLELDVKQIYAIAVKTG